MYGPIRAVTKISLVACFPHVSEMYLINSINFTFSYCYFLFNVDFFRELCWFCFAMKVVGDHIYNSRPLALSDSSALLNTKT